MIVNSVWKVYNLVGPWDTKKEYLIPSHDTIKFHCFDISFIFIVITLVILDVGIVFHCLRRHIRMDGRFIGTLSCNPFYLQLNKKTFCEKWRWWHWSSIYSLPQGNSKNPFLWSSWYNIFLPGSTDSALPFGVPMSWIHHIP